MSEDSLKKYVLNVKELSFKSEQAVVDLIRYIAEQIPQADLKRTANEVEIQLPSKISKRAIKLRIKKFLYKKQLDPDFRPISFRNAEKEGYQIKEKKSLEFTYY